MTHKICYLNSDLPNSPFRSKLVQELVSTKQARASGSQWLGMIKAWSQKGVKQAELAESDLIELLESKPTEVFRREDLVEHAKKRLCVVKEITLDQPKFASHATPGGAYEEILFVAMSERGMVDDEIEAIEDEMATLALDIDRLMSDLDAPARLEARRMSLLKNRGESIDFSGHHYSDVLKGELGRNLIAHTRISFYANQGLLMIHEIQSDWAQRGRKNDWRGIPQGPFVTNTEAWSGLVLKRLLQKAATNPRVQQVAWITATMRNGNEQNLGAEKAQEIAIKQQAILAAELLAGYKVKWDADGDSRAALMNEVHDALRRLPTEKVQRVREEWDEGAMKLIANHFAERAIPAGRDNLNDFYLKVLPKLANKLLGGTDAKVESRTMALNDRSVTVPSIQMTDTVRQKLAAVQPVYSRDDLLPRSAPAASPLQEASALAKAKRMLGSAHHLRLALSVFDESGERVAGKFSDGGKWSAGFVHVCTRAKRFEEVLDHEMFHFAQNRLLTGRELKALDLHFGAGGRLNTLVVNHLRSRGSLDLANQCAQPTEEGARECAAQGFALWCAGRLDVEGNETQGQASTASSIFQSIRSAALRAWGWITGRDQEQVNSVRVAKIFKDFEAGKLAHRQLALNALSQSPSEAGVDACAPDQAIQSARMRL